MPDLGKTSAKFLIALLKHQAKFWLGEDAAGIAAETVLDEDVQTRLNNWLDSEKSAKQLLGAVEKAQLYLQNPRNCPDKDLRYLFRDLTFGDLSSVQEALTKIPEAMDSAEVQDALLVAFRRDLPNLSPEQQEEGARLYTDAMLRAVGSLEEFVSPILIQTVLDLKKEQHKTAKDNSTQHSIQIEKLDKILAHLEARTVAKRDPSPTLRGDLPLGSYLPIQPNQLFTGREAELKQLADTLLTQDGGAIINQQALVGMGGIGKTQLAVQFAWQEGYRFAGVHWVSAYKAEEINSSIALCGQAMELQPWPSQVEQQAFMTTNAMKSKGPRLVILDNLEIYENTSELLARLRHSNIRLLITSRDHELIQKLNIPIFALGPFTPDESLLFLRNNLTSDRADDDELKELSELLHHKPIELDRAVYSLKRYNHLTVTELIKQNKLNHPIRTEIMSDFQTQKMSMALQFLKDQEEVSFVPKHLADVYRTKILDRWLEEFFK